MPGDPGLPPGKRAASLPEPANDNGRARRLRAQVLISHDLPISQTEIEVFAMLMDDLVSVAANDNEVPSE